MGAERKMKRKHFNRFKKEYLKAKKREERDTKAQAMAEAMKKSSPQAPVMNESASETQTIRMTK